MNRWASGYFLVRGFLGGSERDVRLDVLASLEEGTGGVHQESCLPFSGRDHVGVDLPGGVYGASRIPKGNREVHAVQLGVGRAKGCVPQVAQITVTAVKAAP